MYIQKYIDFLYNILNEFYNKHFIELDIKEASTYYYFKTVIIPRDIKLLEKKEYKTLKNKPNFNKTSLKFTLVDIYYLWKNIILKNQRKLPLTFEIADKIMNSFVFIEKEFEKIK